MSPTIRVLVLAAVALAATGCDANFGSIYRSYETLDGEKTKSVVIDAKQRAILAVPAHYVTPDGKNRTRDVIVCAEPSPDALSAISSTFAGSFGGVFGPSEKVEAALASSFSETASQLGERNATIQLLRDGLYRQCEAYMNGLIDQPYYEQISNKYVNAMVTLLAVEELTPNKAKGVKINAGEGATVSANTAINVTPPAPGATEDAADTPVDGESTTTEPETTAGEDGQGQPDSATADAKAPASTINVNLADETTPVSNHVSAAVNNLVSTFLIKDTNDFCLRKLSEDFQDHLGVWQLPPHFVELCGKVILGQQELGRAITAAAITTISGGTFAQDECSEAIRSFWKPGGVVDPENLARIKNEMAQQSLAGDSITFMLNATERTLERHRVGAALGLPKCN